jgi:hypothetical protein
VSPLVYTLLLVVHGQFSVLAAFPDVRECVVWAQHLRATYPDAQGRMFCAKQWRV